MVAGRRNNTPRRPKAKTAPNGRERGRSHVGKVPGLPKAQRRDAVALRVLLVDDDPDARELTALFLEQNGIEVQTADSAADALALLNVHSPQVILSDIGMPFEDGYSLIRRVRALPAPEKKNIPAIAITAFTRIEDKTRAFAEGFDMHVAKPVDLAQLLRVVTKLAQKEH
jgi:CheY-like chemotaxis protein